MPELKNSELLPLIKGEPNKQHQIDLLIAEKMLGLMINHFTTGIESLCVMCPDGTECGDNNCRERMSQKLKRKAISIYKGQITKRRVK